MYVSLERVEENALALGLSYESELRRVVAHGILHLIGFKDKTEEEEKTEKEKETPMHELQLFILNNCKNILKIENSPTLFFI